MVIRPRSSLRPILVLAFAAGVAGCSGIAGDRGQQARRDAPAVPVARVQQQTLPPPGTTAPLITGSLPPATAPGALGAPAAAPGAAAPPPFIPMTSAAIPGEWRVLERGQEGCRVTLAGATSGTPPRATNEGCSTDEMRRVAAWQSRGETVMLLDERGAPIVLMRPEGGGRYEGTGLSRDRYTMLR